MRRLRGVNRGRDQGHSSRCIVARSIEQRTRAHANSPKAAVYTDVRVLEKFRTVPKSLTDQAALGAIARSTSLWRFNRSGRSSVRYGI